MSEPLPVAQAWAAAMAEIKAVGKDSKNTTPGQNYMFRGVDAVMNAAGPAFRNNGVFVIPRKIKTIEYTTVEVGKNKTIMASVRLRVKYRVMGPAGDHFDTEAPGEAFDSGDKATSKAMSVAYRTMLIQSLTLPTGERDPDEDTHERSGHDHTPDQARDLGKWRGMVHAAGRDRVKLKALWDQMKAEWDDIPWSTERHEILQPAVDASTRPPEQQPEQQPAESVPAATGETAPAGPPPPPPGIGDDFRLWFTEAMDYASDELNLSALRNLEKLARGRRAKDLGDLAKRNADLAAAELDERKAK